MQVLASDHDRCVAYCGDSAVEFSEEDKGKIRTAVERVTKEAIDRKMQQLEKQMRNKPLDELNEAKKNARNDWDSWQKEINKKEKKRMEEKKKVSYKKIKKNQDGIFFQSSRKL